MALPRLPGPTATKVQAMAGGRFVLGALCLLAPTLVLKLLGFPERSTTAKTFARMLGVRDLAVGLVILATREDAAIHRKALQAAALVDLGDLAAISLAGLRDPALRRAALLNLPFAGGSAAATLLVADEVA
jgi:hypothetical protein